jgi:hypothetical protein
MITPLPPIGPTVAVGFVASDALYRRLGRELGDRWTVVDIRDAVRSVDVVLVGRCSPQAVVALRREFPEAELVVVEPADETGGPDVCRCISAGAARHVVVDDLAGLAAAVTDRDRARPSAGRAA